MAFLTHVRRPIQIQKITQSNVYQQATLTYRHKPLSIMVSFRPMWQSYLFSVPLATAPGPLHPRLGSAVPVLI